jgi:hypothetical protein
MLANGPLSLRFTLEAVHRARDAVAEAQYLEATLFGLICTTEDMKEGTQAFLEKRPPKFQGSEKRRPRSSAPQAPGARLRCCELVQPRGGGRALAGPRRAARGGLSARR